MAAAPVIHQRWELLYPHATKRPSGDRRSMTSSMSVSSFGSETGVRRPPVMHKAHELVGQASAAAKLAGTVAPRVSPYEERPAPPFQVYTGADQHVIKRSSSHEQFLPPPQHMIQRRPPIIPVSDNDPLRREVSVPLTTSHKAHFAARGVPQRRPAYVPEQQHGLFTDMFSGIKEMEQLPTGSMIRSTSHSQFLQTIVPRMREPFIPPVHKVIVTNDDSGQLRRTTSSEQFQQRVVPRQRDSCRPSRDHQAPFATSASFGKPLSTSQAAFLEMPYAARKPYIPAVSSVPPFV